MLLVIYVIKLTINSLEYEICSVSSVEKDTIIKTSNITAPLESKTEKSILLFLFFTEVNLDTYNVFWKRTINFLYIDIYNLNYIMKNSLKSKQLNLFVTI